MRKRECPFAPSFSAQLKSHIGIKDVNAGAGREEYLQQVYDKTLSTMFKAANTPTTPALCSSQEATSSGCDRLEVGFLTAATRGGRGSEAYVSSSSGVGGRQSLLAACAPGSQAFGGSTSADKHVAEHVTCSGRCPTCGGIAARYSATVLPCSHCCRSTGCCDACIQPCLSCAGFFCSGCSVVNYDEPTSRRLCLGCLS